MIEKTPSPDGVFLLMRNRALPSALCILHFSQKEYIYEVTDF